MRHGDRRRAHLLPGLWRLSGAPTARNRASDGGWWSAGPLGGGGPDPWLRLRLGSLASEPPHGATICASTPAASTTGGRPHGARLSTPNRWASSKSPGLSPSSRGRAPRRSSDEPARTAYRPPARCSPQRGERGRSNRYGTTARGRRRADDPSPLPRQGRASAYPWGSTARIGTCGERGPWRDARLWAGARHRWAAQACWRC